MSGLIGKKIGMTSLFDEQRKKHSLYRYRARTMRGYPSQNRRG